MLETDDGIQIKGFSLRDVRGRKIICEDGVERRVESISYSQRYADKVLVNEVNEDETPGGTWVHCLSLACQMNGLPLPTREQKRAFSKTMSAIRFQPELKEVAPGYIQLPSGIVVSKK